MNTDYALVIGLFLGVLSIPAMLNAYAHKQMPRFSVLVFVVAAGLVLWAWDSASQGYTVPDIPYVIISVIASLIR